VEEVAAELSIQMILGVLVNQYSLNNNKSIVSFLINL